MDDNRKRDKEWKRVKPCLVASVLVEENEHYSHDDNDTEQDECVGDGLPRHGACVRVLVVERSVESTTPTPHLTHQLQQYSSHITSHPNICSEVLYNDYCDKNYIIL